MSKKMCKVRRMDHTGDTVIATYDPVDECSVSVAADALNKFWSDCIDRFGDRGLSATLFGREIDTTEFVFVDKKQLVDLRKYDELLVQMPLTGG